jgi:hypothetical protein
MTDFFADLERQLVAATPRRVARIRRARARRGAAVSIVLVALVAGGAGLASAVSGDHDASTSAGTAPTAPALTVPATPGASPALKSFTTAVLNGTTTPGLGRAVANALQNAGAKIGNVTNAPSQDRARTQVFYARRDCIPAATQVARAIGLRGGLVLRPMTSAQRVIAGATADVVVLVGSDQHRALTP